MHEEAIKIINDETIQDEDKIECLQDMGYDLEDIIFELIIGTCRRAATKI